MKTSETINELAAALAKAQGAMKNATLNKTNPHFRSKYADLAGIRDTVTPALAAHGIAVAQTIGMVDGQLSVTTRLMHLSGQWLESSFPIIADVNKPQAIGSAITYGRRYTLSAICNIAADEDDDGNEAQEQGAKPAEVRAMAGTEGARKSVARADYDGLVRELRSAQTVESLKEWAALRKADINKLPADWIDHLQEEYSKHKDGLTAQVAA